jgi:hypothetical protein
MYTVTFTSPEDSLVQSTSKILECRHFGKTLYQSPSDRHAYAIKFFKSPVSVGRLANTVKDLLKFTRNQKFNIFNSEPGLIAIYHFYGNNGRDERKLDIKSLIFDWDFFTAISKDDFTSHFQSKLDTFVTSLTEEKKPGRNHFFTLFFKCMFTKNNFLMLCCRPTAIHFTF